MANLAAGDGFMGGFPLEQWFYEMPVCTRWWMTAALGASVAVQCKFVSPYQLFYSVRAVFFKSQYWRVITTFFYFGPLSLDLLYHIFFLQRYSRLLEESSGRSPAHFAWLLTFSSTLLLAMAPLFSLTFLGSPLSSTLIYIWSRKNPDTMLSFLGLLVFKAPYLPWVLLCFSLVMHGTIPKDEMCGIVVGHIWYYFTDIFPPLHGGRSPLDPPNWWLRLFERRTNPVPDTDNDVDDHDAAADAVPAN